MKFDVQQLLASALATLTLSLPSLGIGATLADWGIPTRLVSHAGYDLDVDDDREHPLKVCTTGKPCGNTCINRNYTCHVGSGTTYTSTMGGSSSTSRPSGSTAGTVTTVNPQPVIPVWSPAPDTQALKPPTPTTGCAAVQVVAVIDGDTVSVRNELGELERVRIDQIDAPERSQTYGVQATQCLQAMLMHQPIQICRDGKDRYGRTIADILAGGADVGTSMVRSGCAWAYTKYLESGSNLPAVQNMAQASLAGLWGVGSTMAPWQYRAGLQPVPTNAATGTTAIPVSNQTMATDWDRVFDWAEHRFPEFTALGSPTIQTNGHYKRCYAGGTCLSYLNGRFSVVDPQGQAVDVGGVQDLVPVVNADGF